MLTIQYILDYIVEQIFKYSFLYSFETICDGKLTE